MRPDIVLTRQAMLLAALGLGATAGAARAAAPRWIDDFVDLFYRRKQVRTAFERHVSPDYIQHSIGIGPGRDAAIAVLEPMFGRESFSATPLRILANRDLCVVLLHVAVGEDTRALVVDIFRVEGERIVEHWDVKQNVATDQDADYFSALEHQ